MLTDDVIRECLAKYGVEATARHCEQIRTYIALLVQWNRSISLTSVTDELEILKFHFGESAFGLSVVDRIDGRLADVGAGAGFPGIPLRIFNPDIQLILIEANSKKCAFLGEVVRRIGLDDVQIRRERFDDGVGELQKSLNFAVSRALGSYGKLLDWSSKVLANGGKCVLWIAEDDAHDLSRNRAWTWRRPIIIPGSARRVILSGSVVR